MDNICFERASWANAREVAYEVLRFEGYLAEEGWRLRTAWIQHGVRWWLLGFATIENNGHSRVWMKILVSSSSLMEEA